jgi:hypothetical protein
MSQDWSSIASRETVMIGIFFHFFERYLGRQAFDDHNNQAIIQKLLNEDKYIRGVKAKFVKAVPAATK